MRQERPRFGRQGVLRSGHHVQGNRVLQERQPRLVEFDDELVKLEQLGFVEHQQQLVGFVEQQQ